MDRLGSRCPLPGYLRPSVLICLLILTAAFLSYPMLRTLSLQLRSAVTGSYVSGTYSIVFVNCPNEQIARDIARASLDKKLAASVNILPKASSLYFWNGEIEEAAEILLLIKTKTSKVHVLSSYIRWETGSGAVGHGAGAGVCGRSQSSSPEAFQLGLIAKADSSPHHSQASAFFPKITKGIGTALRSSKGVACCVKDGKIKNAHPVSGTSLPAPGSQVEEGGEGRARWGPEDPFLIASADFGAASGEGQRMIVVMSIFTTDVSDTRENLKP
ncbi:uncharacterized protein LOC125083009 [Lutra lutra]|uniref:uncharacterized protein LOC125083009 n=1 Tax=Lutra lutra TaxID=9657 RepID=UPI001FD55CF7|nr:uncharacterized protein LOC125083009 [Lutra lutra]